jgi:solute:Na+ symporter, SSS family
MHLALVDWLILIGFLLLITAIGFSYTKSSGKDLTSFFLGGRDLPWYIAGISMVATTFAADTPLAVADLTGSSGISGNWLWWNMLFGGLLTTFFFARLWRRAEVLTEVEFIELRYTGKVAAFLRGFKAVYLGVFLNVLVIGWVSQAMVSILEVFLGVDRSTGLLITFGLMAFTAAYSAFAGLKGIAVTDGIQFLLAMGGTTALAVLVIRSPEIGGMAGLREAMPEGALNFFPNITGGKAAAGPSTGTMLTIGVGAFLARIGMQWWASWYPGAEPGGGGYVAQRMMSVRSERDSVWATLFFNVAHYCLRPWPWILVGLAAISLYGVERNLPSSDLGLHAQTLIADGADPVWFSWNQEELNKVAVENETASRLLPELLAVSADLQAEGVQNEALGQALRYQQNKQLGYVFAMKDFLPVGLTGLLLASFVAAFMSTISTQLNWGASYLVNDLYDRFIVGSDKSAVDQEKRNKQLIWAARLTTLGLMLISLMVAAGFDSITAIWLFLIECGAGLGLVLILRWYWWRINAVSELTATLASFVFFAISRMMHLEFPQSFLFIVGATTVSWLLATYLSPPEKREHLEAFCRKVMPAGAWGPVRKSAGLPTPPGSLWPLVLAWLCAVGFTYSTLFLSGTIILGTPGMLWYGLAVAGFGIGLFGLARRYRMFENNPV